MTKYPNSGRSTPQTQDQRPLQRRQIKQNAEESEAEVGQEEEESDDEFCDRTTAPVPKWEVLAAGGEQGCVGAALPATAAGSGEFGLEGTERVLVDQVQ